MFLVRPARSPRSILVAESKQAAREFLIQTLAAEGFKIIHAGNGEQALIIGAEYPGQIDLLVTSMTLPGLCGCELAELMKLDHPRLKVLFLYDPLKENAMAVRPTCKQAALKNPFTSRSVIKTVYQLLNERSASNQRVFSAGGDSTYSG